MPMPITIAARPTECLAAAATVPMIVVTVSPVLATGPMVNVVTFSKDSINARSDAIASACHRMVPPPQRSRPKAVGRDDVSR